MNQFRSLMRVALISGVIAGAVLFAYQYVVVVPRILAAEVYERETEAHEHEEWKPADGLQRNTFTAASTILTGIGFAAVFVALVMFKETRMDTGRGVLWGFAGFVCFVGAPALGLPPMPPGAAVADLTARQLWWSGTAAATALGLFLAIRPGSSWALRILGGIVLLLPHLIGAPAAAGPQTIPEQLIREFAIASIVGNGLFWVTLGAAAGLLLRRNMQRSRDTGLL